MLPIPTYTEMLLRDRGNTYNSLSLFQSFFSGIRPYLLICHCFLQINQLLSLTTLISKLYLHHHLSHSLSPPYFHIFTSNSPHQGLLAHTWRLGWMSWGPVYPSWPVARHNGQYQAQGNPPSPSPRTRPRSSHNREGWLPLLWKYNSNGLWFTACVFKWMPNLLLHFIVDFWLCNCRHSTTHANQTEFYIIIIIYLKT